MTDYTREIFDLIDNSEYIFYKLLIDGKCQFDDFVKEVENNVRQSKSIESIYASMEHFSSRIMLPKAKFRMIEGLQRSDVFEFKKDDIRVYVIKAPYAFYIVMGGFKKEQTKDVKRLKGRIENFNPNEQI